MLADNISYFLIAKVQCNLTTRKREVAIIELMDKIRLYGEFLLRTVIEKNNEEMINLVQQKSASISNTLKTISELLHISSNIRSVSYKFFLLKVLIWINYNITTFFICFHLFCRLNSLNSLAFVNNSVILRLSKSMFPIQTSMYLQTFILFTV